MKLNTNEVFGVRNTLIQSYIDRSLVDEKFKEALQEGNEIVVYGSSKQGKTSLILRHLDERKFVKVECSPKTKTEDIYKSILRQLGISFVESSTTEVTNEHGGKISGSFKIKVPVVGEVGLGGELNDKTGQKEQLKSNYIEYNLSLAQDVSELTPAVNSVQLNLGDFSYAA